MVDSDPVMPPGDPAPEVLDDRIWIDGCFDFFHHGHAGAIVQARRLGSELYVGLHSDQAILENKGPCVMTLAERILAVDSCRWVTRSVGRVPYVTQLDWLSHFGCRFVVHGDDHTLDKDGRDCYEPAKAAGRFREVRRSPAISTTDLVGRMLLCTRTHFIRSLSAMLLGQEGTGAVHERRVHAGAMTDRIALYASDASGRHPCVDVMLWSEETDTVAGGILRLVPGIAPRVGQRVVYVDGGFDLFSPGHIEFLRLVASEEADLARREGWFEPEAIEKRCDGLDDYPPAYIVVGVQDDETINSWKGVNYPIMNIYERSLCVLQCKYVSAVVLGAPFTPSRSFLRSLPWEEPDAVYHGPSKVNGPGDPYADARAMGRFRELGPHAFDMINSQVIVSRILQSRESYEARQRSKGVKMPISPAEGIRRRQQLEEEQRCREAQREAADTPD